MKAFLIAVGLLMSSFGNSDAQQIEVFTNFFKKFEYNRNFHFSRISFPVKAITTDEYDKKTTTFITPKQWHYTNLLNSKKEKYLLRISRVNSKEYSVQISIEDTGVSVEYVFRLNNGKWWLVEIFDQST